MSKTKRKQQRPCYKCLQCRTQWISDDNPVCILCGETGLPMNAEAERVIEQRTSDRKRWENGR